MALNEKIGLNNNSNSTQKEYYTLRNIVWRVPQFLPAMSFGAKMRSAAENLQ